MIKENKQIISQRFFLREIDENDVTQKYLDWFSDDEVKRWIITAVEFQTLLELRQYVCNCIACDDVLFWGIFENTTGKHIGNIKYDPVNSTEGYAIMGILIGDITYRGCGVAAEVLRVSGDWLKKHRNINQILLGVNKNNLSAMRAYEKVGFVITDTPHIKATSGAVTMCWTL